MGQITLTIEEWQRLVRGQADAEARSAQLAQQVTDLQVQLSDQGIGVSTAGTTKTLLEAIGAARDVIRFSVANYPPEAVKGWPHEALKRFADILESVPGATQDYKDMAIDLRAFAKEAKTVEDMRKRRDAAGLVAPTVSDYVALPPTDTDFTT